ncbi:MAG: hypothetical protein A2284_12930 [Deltaproteobacteria bacterium RIFOXYA12_FULL_61_11]|nr:MAG: hypothetical protein A2284_12930 [Deltaproteobacteria bacterium RIFOXYA12_FULL_61_11]
MRQRASIRTKKRLTLKFGTSDLSRTGVTNDLSMDGLKIQANTQYKPGTLLHIELHVTTAIVLRLSGMVRWAKRCPPALVSVMQPGMGVQLDRASQDYERYVKVMEALLGGKTSKG